MFYSYINSQIEMEFLRRKKYCWCGRSQVPALIDLTSILQCHVVQKIRTRPNSPLSRPRLVYQLLLLPLQHVCIAPHIIGGKIKFRLSKSLQRRHQISATFRRRIVLQCTYATQASKSSKLAGVTPHYKFLELTLYIGY